MGERIAVLGAAGFIGSNMVAFLKQRGHSVRAVARSFDDHPERSPLFSQADELVEADLLGYSATLRAAADMDYVIHLAADMGGVGYFHDHDYYPFMTNMRIDSNVLHAVEAMSVKRLFYASSACVYPTHLQMGTKAPRLAEDMLFPARADQMYGWEKLMALQLCQRAPFDARVGILHTVYGPYQERAGEKMKFPTAIATKALSAKATGGPIEIWGDGSQIRSYCYIDDALEKIYRVLMADNYEGPVNIGSEQAVTCLEVAKTCCAILGIPENFVFNDARPSGVLARNCDSTKFRRLYGYDNHFTIEQGFAKLLDYLQAAAH